LVDELIQLYTV